MAPVVREAVAKATRSVIWNRCFRDMNWEEWDHDVDHMEDFTSCTDGATCTFVMKDSNIKAPVKLSVVPEESLIFSGSMLGGLAKFTGDIRLTSVGVESTKINYSFEMKGFVGMLLNTFKSKEIVGGTEKGLENIVKLSEEAQKK